MNILVAPNTNRYEGKKNAKEYPFWDEFYKLLEKENAHVKVVEGKIPYKEIVDMVKWSDAVVTVDSFLPHLIEFYKIPKKVIVLYGKSDVDLFGYPNHIALIKDRKNMRKDRYNWWKDEPYDPSVFVLPEEIIKHL